MPVSKPDDETAISFNSNVFEGSVKVTNTVFVSSPKLVEPSEIENVDVGEIVPPYS